MIRTRLLPGLLATLTCAALVAGCGSEDPGPDPTGPAGSESPSAEASADGAGEAEGAGDGSGEAGTALPEATGEFGDAPEFTFPESAPPADLQVEVLSEGDGPMVQPGAAVLAHYAGIVWGGDTTFDDSYSRGAASMFSLSGVVQGWTEGIPEHPVGSRLLISIPPDLGYGPSGGNPQAGIGAEDTIVFVVDVVETYNPDMTGQEDATVQTEAAELPVEVAGELGEPATVTIPEDAEEPAELEVITLAEGSGDPVAAGDQVALAYAVDSWDGSMQGSSWPSDSAEGTGPFAAAAGQGSIVDAVVDIPVGSRVLLLVPGNEQQPATAYVVDVLGAA
ncbi:FKBP-type peptidyl-prolyl cis-trans isomerase [Ruania zhangjianzhongii]|uniref:FKBP-type peptidyl-prolyl cis-trans isomerase n=1 Tax=Ruania zhangjianzhongii TaxID=2603206 RepID=UPI0011C9DE7D|nr:FKBP-type peptidyl-prolyl cis-trans isomerase [Ruania zhangjianzhongii]